MRTTIQMLMPLPRFYHLSTTLRLSDVSVAALRGLTVLIGGKDKPEGWLVQTLMRRRHRSRSVSIGLTILCTFKEEPQLTNHFPSSNYLATCPTTPRYKSLSEEAVYRFLAIPVLSQKHQSWFCSLCSSYQEEKASDGHSDYRKASATCILAGFWKEGETKMVPTRAPSE